MLPVLNISFVQGAGIRAQNYFKMAHIQGVECAKNLLK
jgi:hypothetical protein